MELHLFHQQQSNQRHDENSAPLRLRVRVSAVRFLQKCPVATLIRAGCVLYHIHPTSRWKDKTSHVVVRDLIQVIQWMYSDPLLKAPVKQRKYAPLRVKSPEMTIGGTSKDSQIAET